MASGDFKDFRLEYDDRVVQAYFDTLDEKGVVKILRGASTRAGTVMRNAMRPQVPVKARAAAGATGSYRIKRKGTYVPKEYGKPGEMRASVQARRIKRNPAIGVVVAPMGKNAFMRHWVAKGTKPHIIPGKGIFGFLNLVEHPGAKPNDYTGRVNIEPAVDRAEKYIWEQAKP